MRDEDCYECGCCDCMGLCEIHGKYINEVEECSISEEEKWRRSCWNLHTDEE